MSKKPFPALCSECKFSKPEENSAWNLKCINPQVNAKDSYALASASCFRGSDCRGEREKKTWFAVCGMAGRKWEPK